MNIGELLEFAVNNDASDLHLSAGLAPMVRIDGDLRRIEAPALDHAAVLDLVTGVMNDARRARGAPGDRLLDRGLRTGPVSRQRVQPASGRRCGVPDHPFEGALAGELGAPAVFREIADTPRGVVLVTGRRVPASRPPWPR